MNCKECCNYKEIYKLNNNMCLNGSILCKLDNILHSPTGREAEKCKWYQVEPEDKKICYNCKYYLGGSDWGLSCSKDYYRLVNATDKICKEYNKKEK